MKPQQGRTARCILWALGFPLALWLAAALADAFSGGASLSRVLARFSVCMNAPFSVRWTEDTGRFLLLAGLLYPAGAVAVESGRGNRRPGEEYGSARWGDPRTIGKKYRDRRHREKNILLTQHVALGLDGRITKRNTHQLIVGGSGAGKTRYFCLPNVMNACCSYIITDCKGEILRAVGGLLEKQGIPFTVLDLVNMRGHYNPFAYLRRDSDALRLVTNLVANTTPKDAKNSDPFWDRAETALLQALILYLKHRAPVCEQNFTMVMEMINAAEVREGDPNFKSALDLLFDELESEEPQSIALKQYKVFKQAQDKTAKSILIGAAVRLAAFNLPELARVTDSDEMYIGRLGEEKRAIFCVIPDNDTSLNFLVSMLYTQAFQELYYIADQKYGGPLPVHVQCIQDEWANTPQPDNYLQILRTARSRNIGCSVVVQGLSAIKAMYKESWEEVVGNCDSFLFLGGNDQESLSYISKMTGKATIDTITRGETKGRGGSSSRNFQNTGRELVTPEELRILNTDDDVLICDPEAEFGPVVDAVRGQNIRLAPDSTQHVNALELGKGYEAGEKPVSLKSEFILTLYEHLLDVQTNGRRAKSIIDRAVLDLYEEFSKKPQAPTLQDLYRILQCQKENLAKDIVLASEIFTKGSLNTFAQPTNVQLDNRVLCFNIRDLGQQLRPIGMLVLMEVVMMRVMQNRLRGKRTWIYFDELSVLFSYEWSTNFLDVSWKRYRKYGALASGIFQNLDQALDNEVARSMISNSEFLVLLNQAASDRTKLAELLHISDTQLSYVTDSEAGRGLLKMGGSLVPFINDIPKDTQLYKLMSTRPGEV